MADRSNRRTRRPPVTRPSRRAATRRAPAAEAPPDDQSVVLHSLMHSAPEAMIVCDSSLAIQYFNRAAERLYGWRVEDVRGQSLNVLIPERLRRSHEALIDLFRRRAITGITASGEEIPIESSISRVTVDGRVFFTTIHRDLRPALGGDGASRARAETLGRQTRLNESPPHAMVSWAAEDALKRFVAASPAVIFALNVDEAGELHHQWASPNLADLTGFVSDGTIDRGWWTSHLHPDDRSRVIAAHSAPYDVDHQVLEYRFQREDGSYVWLRDEKRLYRDAQGRPIEVVGSWSDITGRMALEQQFRQAQKMEAVGRLAGGVAHDFNNLLTVICGLSELMLQELPDDDVNRSLVVDIQRAGQRAVSLTRQLLAFSRKQVLNPKVIDLERIVGEVESMLRRLIGEDILLVIRTTGREQLARVDPGQLEQVMLNLAVNARDAMPKGGQLSIETGAVELTYEYCRQHPGSRPGRYVRLIVRDTGSGMPPDVVARLFEPFFTTKEAGKGTGLGLAMVFGIIKQSDGYIEVESEVGKGSAFIVYLPAVGGSQTDDEDAPSPSRVSSSGRETILLVEDEEDVRRLSKRALESFGYRVLEAASGEDALAIARANAATISLLITDVVMPGLSGPEVADRLTARHSSMRVLFVSGYIDDAVVRHGVVDGEHAFLQKPFMPAALAAKVREILDR